MNKKPTILITNDDGIFSPGIRALIHMMNSYGNVYVVAPSNSKSGVGHAITMDTILYCDFIKIDKGIQKEWKCSGTPVDCIKLAINDILPKKPNICIAGINYGSNSSINVMYSGTMSAAIEASIEGIPSIGFSLVISKFKKINIDFFSYQEYICKIVKIFLNNYYFSNHRKKTIISLNVNIPNLKKEKIKGIKICRQSKSKWKEKFDKRFTPKGKTYYWLMGDFINYGNKENDTDEWALSNGYISIVPIQFDLTNYSMLNELKSWNFIFMFFIINLFCQKYSIIL